MSKFIHADQWPLRAEPGESGWRTSCALQESPGSASRDLEVGPRELTFRPGGGAHRRQFLSPSAPSFQVLKSVRKRVTLVQLLPVRFVRLRSSASKIGPFNFDVTTEITTSKLPGPCMANTKLFSPVRTQTSARSSSLTSMRLVLIFKGFLFRLFFHFNFHGLLRP